jgi:putative ABC transport system permease protein
LLPGDTNAIVMNTAMAAAHERFSTGQTLTLRIGQTPTSFRIVGIVREPMSAPTGYVPREYWAGMVNNVHVALDRTGRRSVEEVKQALDVSLKREDLHAASISDTAGTRFSFDQHMLMIYVFLVVVTSIIGAIGGLGLMTAMSLNVLERRREMGVLRAIGASPSAIGLIVIGEGVMAALISWALAALGAWPLSKVGGDLLWKRFFSEGLDFRFELSGLLLWFAASLLLGVVASVLPAWNASRSTVREALSHE